MIFISYRIKDSNDLTDRLDADLAREFGRDVVFRDKKRLEGGMTWEQELETNAKTCQVMLVMIGPQWQSAQLEDGQLRLADPQDWVRREVNLALTSNSVVIPVRLNGQPMPPKNWLKNYGLQGLAGRQSVQLRT